jgi:hypothetical protein
MIVARYEVPGNKRNAEIRPGRDDRKKGHTLQIDLTCLTRIRPEGEAMIVARYEVPGNKRNAEIRPVRDDRKGRCDEMKLNNI